MPNLGEMRNALGSAALTWLPLIFFGFLIYLICRGVAAWRDRRRSSARAVTA